MGKTILLLIITVAVVGCQFDSPPQLPTQTLTVDDEVRRYQLRVPLDTSRALPLVIAWHGVGDSADSFMQYSQWDQLAVKEGFLLAVPDSGGKMWQILATDDDGEATSRDIKFFDHLVNDVARKVPVDRDRIYVMGMSQGAIFVYALAKQRPDEIAAAVVHSASMPRGMKLDATMPPLFMIAGTEDLVCGAMREDAESLAASGVHCQMTEVPGIGHQWSTRYNNAMWTYLKSFKLSARTQPK
ncbi:alpha/beta hydrolase family esterase [Bremerella cremea]|uniref:alpha/beta hydrolase family esterase n=1 Tax=Bremerella cremea TaxID=1031537 RepID=UPI0031F1485C